MFYICLLIIFTKVQWDHCYCITLITALYPCTGLYMFMPFFSYLIIHTSFSTPNCSLLILPSIGFYANLYFILILYQSLNLTQTWFTTIKGWVGLSHISPVNLTWLLLAFDQFNNLFLALSLIVIQLTLIQF